MNGLYLIGVFDIGLIFLSIGNLQVRSIKLNPAIHLPILSADAMNRLTSRGPRFTSYQKKRPKPRLWYSHALRSAATAVAVSGVRPSVSLTLEFTLPQCFMSITHAIARQTLPYGVGLL